MQFPDITFPDTDSQLDDLLSDEEDFEAPAKTVPAPVSRPAIPSPTVAAAPVATAPAAPQQPAIPAPTVSEAARTVTKKGNNGFGQPWERTYTPEQLAERKARKAAGELLPGNKRINPAKVYNRSYPTETDRPGLSHTAEFVYTTRKIQLLLHPDLADSTVNNRIRGQIEAGWLYEIITFNGRKAYGLTEKGLKLADINGFARALDCPETDPEKWYTGKPEHVFAISMVAAQLKHGGFYDVDNTQRFTGPIKPEQIINEASMSRAFGRLEALAKKNDTHALKLLQQEREVAKKNVLAGRYSWPEVFEEQPALRMSNPWGALGDNGKREAKHTPDIVIDFEHERKDAPVSIAVEVELTDKGVARYRKILENIAEDNFAFSQVVYIYRDIKTEPIVQHLRRADEEFGLEKAGRLHFQQLRNCAGEVFTGRLESIGG